MDRARHGRYRLVVAFVAGTVFFGFLPTYAPPVVLQSDEIPRFLLGLTASSVAGATLMLIVRGAFGRGLAATAASVLLGATLYTFLYAIPTYGISAEPVQVWPFLIEVAVVYLGVPAAVGATLAWVTSTLVSFARRRRGEER